MKFALEPFHSIHHSMKCGILGHSVHCHPDDRREEESRKHSLFYVHDIFRFALGDKMKENG